MVRDGKKVTSSEARGYAKRVVNPREVLGGCYSVSCFSGTTRIPVTCVCLCNDAQGTVCGVLGPVPCVCVPLKGDVGGGPDRGLIFIDRCKDSRSVGGGGDERCAALIPIDEAGTLGCYQVRPGPGSATHLDPDPCCYCYPMPSRKA